MVEIVCGSTAVATNKMAAMITAVVMTRVRIEVLISAICAAFRILADAEEQPVYWKLRPSQWLLTRPEDCPTVLQINRIQKFLDSHYSRGQRKYYFKELWFVTGR